MACFVVVSKLMCVFVFVRVLFVIVTALFFVVAFKYNLFICVVFFLPFRDAPLVFLCFLVCVYVFVGPIKDMFVFVVLCCCLCVAFEVFDVVLFLYGFCVELFLLVRIRCWCLCVFVYGLFLLLCCGFTLKKLFICVVLLSPHSGHAPFF